MEYATPYLLVNKAVEIYVFRAYRACLADVYANHDIRSPDGRHIAFLECLHQPVSVFIRRVAVLSLLRLYRHRSGGARRV